MACEERWKHQTTNISGMLKVKTMLVRVTIRTAVADLFLPSLKQNGVLDLHELQSVYLDINGEDCVVVCLTASLCDSFG